MNKGQTPNTYKRIEDEATSGTPSTLETLQTALLNQNNEFQDYKRKSEENIVTLQKEYDDKFRQVEKSLSGVSTDFEDRVESKQSQVLQLMAIFITLFTFISVNVTLFTKITDLALAVWFMFLMTLCSALILSVSLLLIDEKNRKLKIAVIVSISILTGVLMFLSKVGFITTKVQQAPSTNNAERIDN